MPELFHLNLQYQHHIGHLNLGAIIHGITLPIATQLMSQIYEIIKQVSCKKSDYSVIYLTPEDSNTHSSL